MLIDTHCHLDFADFDADRDAVIERAASAGVAHIINVSSSLDGAHRSVALARRYPAIVAAVGIHPHDAATVTDAAIAAIAALAAEKKVVAIGEVGLDYYRNHSPHKAQITAFTRFIHLAIDRKLPLIIHSRDAHEETLEILKREGKRGGLRGVIHCFGGDERFLNACLELGLYISFTANLTFTNARAIHAVAGHVPLERLLLETDAPYLAPEGMRGQRNEPAQVAAVAAAWAKIKGLSVDDIARITTHNANTLFSLGLPEPAQIAYPIRDSLYLNITNVCTNACDFCVRASTAFVKGHNLCLAYEPSADEIIAAIGDVRNYHEIVFCGYGEPMTRLAVVLQVARFVKEHGGRVRVVTNGHGNLINGRSIARELAGCVDRVSVSLNADTAEHYAAICKPAFGAQAYAGVQAFIRECVQCGIAVEATCLNLPGVDTKRCEEIARSLGAQFRLRLMGVVG